MSYSSRSKKLYLILSGAFLVFSVFIDFLRVFLGSGIEDCTVINYWLPLGLLLLVGIFFLFSGVGLMATIASGLLCAADVVSAISLGEDAWLVYLLIYISELVLFVVCLLVALKVNNVFTQVISFFPFFLLAIQVADNFSGAIHLVNDVAFLSFVVLVFKTIAFLFLGLFVKSIRRNDYRGV